MLKRLLLFVSLLLEFTSMAADVDVETYFYDFVSDGLCYTIKDRDNYEVEVKGTTLTQDLLENRFELRSLHVPSEVVINKESYAVRGIGSYAFRNCSNLSSISIDNGVSYIGYSCFEGCANLTRIDLPQTLVHIEGKAFKECSKLFQVTLPSQLATVGNEAFMNCSLLRSLSFPASVAEVDASVFYGCNSLSIILVDEANPCMMSVDGVLYNKVQTTLICCPDARTSALVLPRSVAFISYHISEHTKANCISCYSEIPPIFSYEDLKPLELSVFVPKLVVESYRQNPLWARFNVHPF